MVPPWWLVPHLIHTHTPFQYGHMDGVCWGKLFPVIILCGIILLPPLRVTMEMPGPAQGLYCNLQNSLEPSPFPRKGLAGTHCSRMCWIYILFSEKSMIGQWVWMHFYDKLAQISACRKQCVPGLYLDKAATWKHHYKKIFADSAKNVPPPPPPPPPHGRSVRQTKKSIRARCRYHL